MLQSSTFWGVNVLPLPHCHGHWALPLRWVVCFANKHVTFHFAYIEGCVVQGKVRSEGIMCGCAREAARYVCFHVAVLIIP